MLLNILLITFAVVIAIQFLYYIVFFSRFTFAKTSTKKKSNHLTVSVIVCAKNEANNIREFIPLLASQDYTDFEMVLIDDSSSDETLDLLEAFEKEYQNIRLVKVANNEAFWGNKKYALTLGIKAAKNDHLLFIDADCYPTSTQWISEMMSHFNSQKTIVLGYGAYENIKGSFLNKIIRFETLLTAVQYFSWAKLGKPYMGVGRNLAYHKSEFWKVNGFIEHMKIRSGDDDLFINQAADNKNTTICFSEESFTKSKPKNTYKDWFNQKRRHVTTAKYYKTFDKIQLMIFALSQLLFFILAFILLAFQHQWLFVLILIFTRYLFTWTSLGYGAAKLKEKDVMYWFPIIEIILIFTHVNIYFTNIFSKPALWK